MNGIMLLDMLLLKMQVPLIKTLDEKPFLYGKEDYKNPSLLIKRAENLND